MINSIRNKLFWVIALILLFNILITLFFGHSLMEKFYIENKKSELTTAYASLKSLINLAGNDVTVNEPLAEKIFEIEKNNINVLMFTQNEDAAQVTYYSRGNRLSPPKEGPGGLSPIPRYSPERWIAQGEAQGVFTEANLPLLSAAGPDNHAGRTLDLYGRLTTTDYLFLSTPQEPLALAAGLGVQYNLYISLATFCLGLIAIYLLSKRFTQPIQDIDRAAKRISERNFNEPCQITTGDELEALSKSINIMSNQLQAYIKEMELNQELLEKDLAREAKTNQLRKELITNVSHDFKTPLTLIRAYSEALQNQDFNPENNQAYCQIIIKESERMNNLVSQLLQLSKLESGIVVLEESFFPINDMIADILARSQILIKEKQLMIHFTPQDDYLVYGDYYRLEQVFVNLLDNAIKYSPPKGGITVQIALLANNRYRIAITNTSPPIPAHQLENLFMSFYKQDQSRKSSQNSFGLGLAIVKAIMDLHQQPCGALNTPQGVQFWLHLPAVTDV